MLNKDQSQNIGDSAIAVQAGGSVTLMNVGITVSEARQIALDVAKTTFYELSGAAKDIAIARVEDITNRIIKKLESDFPGGLQKAVDPDFQCALLTVQKEFARNGDEDLGELLVDLLIDRSKQDQRDLLQIVLNESLSTAPKLTDENLAALSAIFLFMYTQHHSVCNHQMLGEYLDRNLLPFAPKLSKNLAGFQHLEFTGCGSIGFSGGSLEGIIGTTYQGQFLKGFDQSEIASRGISVGPDPRFFIKCLNDPLKLQVRANSEEVLVKTLDQEGISPEDKAKIIELFNLGKMSESEINEKLIALRPYMSEVLDIWKNSSMKTFTLTSVGMAIGHANIKRLIGEFASLSMWIN
jgi:hypothetical protein